MLLFLAATTSIGLVGLVFWSLYSYLEKEEDRERRQIGLPPLAEEERNRVRGDLLGYRHSRTEARIRVAYGDDEYSEGFVLMRLLGYSTREAMDALGAIYAGTSAGKVILAGTLFGLACLGLGGWLIHVHHYWYGIASLMGCFCSVGFAWIEARDWWEEAISMASPAWILFWLVIHFLGFVVSVAVICLKAWLAYKT